MFNPQKKKKQITVFSGILIKDKKIFMDQRFEEELSDAHMKWEFPGGKCEFGETPQETVKREFLEETGINVSVLELLPFTQTRYWEYKDEIVQTLCFIFLCEYNNEKEVLEKDHHVHAVGWFSAEEVQRLPSLPGTHEIMTVLEEKYPELI